VCLLLFCYYILTAAAADKKTEEYIIAEAEEVREDVGENCGVS